MSEQQFEDFLKRNAGDYNAPPAATPRDEMWASIARARAPKRIVRPTRRYAPWIGMAATLLIGIGIGRFALSTSAPVDIAQADSASRAADATPVTEVRDAADDSTRTIPETEAPQGDAGRGSLDAPVTRLVSAPTQRTLPAATRAEPNTAFTLASRDHLQRAEALVSVVAATPADATMDSLTGKWAREMLTNTRLLLDSPAGDDPVRRRLLEDLETVLVQLIQRSGTAVEERELLDRTLERTQLLTRLRTGAAGI